MYQESIIFKHKDLSHASLVAVIDIDKDLKIIFGNDLTIV